MCQPGDALGCPPPALGMRPARRSRRVPARTHGRGSRQGQKGDRPGSRTAGMTGGAGGLLEPSGPLPGLSVLDGGPPLWALTSPGAARGPQTGPLPCPVGTAGVRPPRASGLRKWAPGPRCWQPGGPCGVTPGRFTHSVRAPGGRGNIQGLIARVLSCSVHSGLFSPLRLC